MDEYFITAEAICQKENGKLTSLTTIEENSFVNQLVQNETNFQEAWIGLQIDNSGDQTWTDKNVVDYTNYMFGRPVLSSKGCAIIIPGGRWADITCYHLRPFVCKKGMLLFKKVVFNKLVPKVNFRLDFLKIKEVIL